MATYDQQRDKRDKGISMNVELDFEKRYRLVREVIETLVLTLLMFLVIRMAVQNFAIDGTSMETSLHNRELVLVDKWSYLFRTPQRGDVIVFNAPPEPGTDFIKRVIAVPGDVITVNNGVPTVNGVTLKEFYVAPGHMGPYTTDRTVNHEVVPPGDYFVMGDNRIGSYDSRSWGFVPMRDIIGRAALVYWPLGQNNDGLLPSTAAVFAHVPPPQAASQNSQGAIHHAPTDTVSVNQIALLAIPSLFVVCFWYRKKRGNKR
jgi:signal peptidase I